jgi:hypothetical protein
MEAYKEKYVLIGRIRVKGNRWGVDRMIPEDLDSVTITREGLTWRARELTISKGMFHLPRH